MSRVGRKPIPIPKGVKVEKSNGVIKVSGPKGELTAQVHPRIEVEISSDQILVKRKSDTRIDKALHGLWRSLINNMIVGVTEGYTKKLEIVGIGYRAELKGKALVLYLGYSHPIIFIPPDGVKVEVPQPTNIVVSGIDKQLVGQVAAKIRSFRPPEPYKGKGIRYEGEVIRMKAGKSAGK
ncbi:LSU ribosomal protein L6P [Candidatus Thermokryptus mobilis]|uniref:Large ribosomal subunit protein uL6 n=1 Tax=Candidatus Thermokryptus mobilis TaxID=1643428 RepID=A0A0S4MRN0_9BACT|nr:50S ribosomal protein L6 [Candidatus Thermokryptus mobilis]CUU01179.1 LSU ribosomal protein L6P [Candidatus Thermokryptus mobilis]